MPNWCENVLTIAGKREDVGEVLNKILIDGEPYKQLDFNAIIPMPAELVGTTAGHPKDANAADLKAKHGFENWYDWSIANWGTKWNAGDVGVDDEVVEDGTPDVPEIVSRSLRFDTAWSPALPVVEKLAEQFPKVAVHLRFEEPGMDFAGSRTYAMGREVSAIDLNSAPSSIEWGYYRVDEYLDNEEESNA